MKREIKFRGQKPCRTEWEYFSLNEYFENDDNPTFLEYKMKNIGQYTGLKDKNGVEIYDGDIVEFVGGTCDVLTDHYSRHAIGKVLAVKLLKSGFTLIPTPTDYKSETPNTCGFIGNYQLWNNSRSLNVIGNIYENPELLNK